jgi:hypothetical protein
MKRSAKLGPAWRSTKPSAGNPLYGSFAPYESLSAGQLTIKTYLSNSVYPHMRTWSQSNAIEIMANQEGK